MEWVEQSCPLSHAYKHLLFIKIITKNEIQLTLQTKTIQSPNIQKPQYPKSQTKENSHPQVIVTCDCLRHPSVPHPLEDRRVLLLVPLPLPVQLQLLTPLHLLIRLPLPIRLPHQIPLPCLLLASICPLRSPLPRAQKPPSSGFSSTAAPRRQPSPRSPAWVKLGKLFTAELLLTTSCFREVTSPLPKLPGVWIDESLGEASK